MANKFGGFDFDANFCILTDHPESRSSKLRTGDVLGDHGGYSGGGLDGSSQITVGGYVKVPSSGTPNIIELWRRLEAACKPGTPLPLRLSHMGERFMWAERGNINEVHASPGYIGARRFEIEFVLADPYFYQNQEQGPQVLTVGGSTNVFNGGNRDALPRVQFLVSHPGTVTLAMNSRSMSIFANLPGTYVVEARDQYITRNTASYFYRWDGQMPTLAPGNNGVLLTMTHGTASAATIRFHARD